MNKSLVARSAAITAFAVFSAYGQTTFTNSGAITCAVGTGAASVDFATGTACSSYPSNITVSGMTGTVTNVQVQLNNISIDRQQDLIAVLVGPNGANLVVISDAGNSLTTNSTGITLTLSDAAANSLDQASYATGTFKPTGFNTGLANRKDNFPSPAPTQANLVYPSPFGSATLASQFNGINPNGTWSLYVIDDSLGPPAGSGGISGINIVGGWSLIVTSAAASAPTATVVTSSVNPSFTGNSVTFTATVTSAGNPVTLGSVQFFEGASALTSPIALNGSGQASFNTSALTQGNHIIRADYLGATGFNTSNGSVNQEVNNATVITGNNFCNTGGIAVVNDVNSPAAVPYPSKIFASGLSGTISGLTLDLKGLTGGRADDFELLLVGPNGAKFVFMNDVGGANAVTGLNVTLSDAAASQLPDETVFGSGTFRPTAVNSTAANFPSPAPAAPYNFAAPFGAATFASNFNGATPNGTWSLYFVDDASGGTQSQITNGWCLNFTTTSDPATTTTVTSSLNPSFTTSPNNSVTFTATVRRADNNALVTTGTVTFTEGATVLSGPTALNGSGQAAFTTTSLSEGTHTVTATYNGAPGQFNLSNGNYVQTVNNHTVVSGLQFCNPGPLTVPSSGVAVQYPSRIFVSGLSGVLNNLNLTLRGMNGVRPDDLDVLLVGPTGAKFIPLTDAGGPTDAVGITLTLADSAGSLVPDSGPLSTGTFRPSSYSPTGDIFPSPAPAGPHNEAAPTGAATFASVFQGTDPNGTWQLFVNDDSLGGPGAFANGYCLDFTIAPDLTITKAHSGNFTQGQTGAQYSITVNNSSASPAAGTITVVDTLPAGLTATAISGSGWNCTLGTLTCDRSDGLGANSSFPPITLTVNVSASAPSSVTNSATVTWPGELNTSNNTANDITTVIPLVPVTITTSPAGRTIIVDGTPLTSPQTFNFVPGSNHTIATTTPQSGGAGVQYVFNNWSDSGAIAHVIITPASATTFTANFTTQYQLTTTVSPGGSGTITPASGFFNAGPVVVTAAANSGFNFANFSGALTGATNPQTLTLSAPASVTANFSPAGTAVLSSLISGKTGAANARVWSFRINNTGTGPAVNAQVDSISFLQQAGTACTPVISTALPVSAGTISAASNGTAPVTIDFSGCASTARFRVTWNFSANSGAATGTMTLYNQFQ